MREMSALGMPVVAAIPEIFIRFDISSCFAAALRTAASRNSACNSLVLNPESNTNPASGSKSCDSAFFAEMRTSALFD
jgi:hypothetical protein